MFFYVYYLQINVFNIYAFHEYGMVMYGMALA